VTHPLPAPSLSDAVRHGAELAAAC
jgi:hypothetical protein